MGICTTKRIFNPVISFEAGRIKCKNLCRAQRCAVRFFLYPGTAHTHIHTQTRSIRIDCTSLKSNQSVALLPPVQPARREFLCSSCWRVRERVYCLCENAAAAHGRLIKRARGRASGDDPSVGRGRPAGVRSARVFVLCEPISSLCDLPPPLLAHITHFALAGYLLLLPLAYIFSSWQFFQIASLLLAIVERAALLLFLST